MLPLYLKNRIIGEKYINKKGQLCIWDGKISRCEHNRQRCKCVDCMGSSICEHKKDRSQCALCEGISLCEHGIQKHKCKPCGGCTFCKHGIQKLTCRDCDGSDFCEHNKRKQQCKECGKQYRCEHGKIKYKCANCDGSQTCKHKLLKRQCKRCKGACFCKHSKYKQTCSICFTYPQNFCKSCKQVYIKGESYYPYCFHCYCYLNPDEEIPHRYMMKENYINDFLIGEIKDLVHNKTIDNGCSKRRPDWLKDCFTHSVIIECDENSHKHVSYEEECQNRRTMELFEDLGSRPIVFIRFNPDSYKDFEGCFKFNSKNRIVPTKEWDKRKKKLLKIINHHIDSIPEKEVTIDYLYFD